VAAALKHHIVNRENVLSRMLPRISRRWRPWDRRDGQMPKSSPQRSTPPLQRLLLLAWLAAVAVIPYAAAQTVLYDKSRLSVVSRQMNVPVEAPFKKFSAQIDFDPLKPDAGKARIEVEVGSFDIGDAEVNEDVKSKSWFDAKTHPKAVFVTSSVRALGGGRFEARGPLTIKGKTLEVVALFTYKDEASMAVYEGHFPIKRLQYNIGEGVWKDTDTVADEVLIKFRLVIAKATVAGKK
jgi:polyisoprenoid-binding protein YceI